MRFYTKNIPKDGFLYKEMGAQDHSKNNPFHFRVPDTKLYFHLNIAIYNNIAIYKFLFQPYGRIIAKTSKGNLALCIRAELKATQILLKKSPYPLRDR